MNIQHSRPGPQVTDGEHGDVYLSTEGRTYDTDTGVAILLEASKRGSIGASVDIHDFITRMVLRPSERKHRNGDPFDPIELRVVTHIYEDEEESTILVWEDNSGYNAYHQRDKPREWTG